MPSAIFLDTNILIYAASGKKSEPRKWAISLDLLEDPNATISAQVMAEFHFNVLKKGYLDEARAARWLETLSMMPVVPVDSALVLEGAAIARRYRISYWDAALLAASQRSGAEVLYTEDLNHGQLYEQVRAINPFREK
jgi:predicted nucleic acid-binding protein